MKSSTLQPVMNTLQPSSFFTNFNYFIQYSNIAIQHNPALTLLTLFILLTHITYTTDIKKTINTTATTSNL
ncbi:hypothetical protein COTS27_01029 [Spirochaetota bacterium]|nr:hypothetical protein COTS27_01029 [Spirochaetota bacterium]